ncbi:MAG: Uncharacterized protein XD53_0121 [Petrotoga mobilis]|nr:MAG: Uncharacterized protein XD53_0121 [Petrotoga mobilis]
MLRSMYSGITGLRNFQDQLDIVANNIANVNTVGYKGSRATFQTTLFQTLNAGNAPQNQLGGTNPMQIGLGSQLASIDKLMTQGSPMSTGKATDLMIQGEGFFILSDGTGQYYTRAGNFTRDYNGFFVDPASGMKLQGWTAKINQEGKRIIDTNDPIGDIQISSGQVMAAKQTSFVRLAHNLNAGAGIQDTTIVVKSTTGENIPVKFSFKRDMSEENKDKNVYNWTASVVGSDYKFAVDNGSGTLTSTTQISGKVELDDTGNVISWVNYDINGVLPLAESKISIYDNGVPREVIQPPSGGAIRFTDLNNPTNFSEANYISPAVTTSTVVYDSLGNPYNVYLKFSKIDANTWYWKAELEDGTPLYKSTADGQLVDDSAEGVIAFDSNGNIAATQWKINTDGTIDQTIGDGDDGAAGFWFDPAELGAALDPSVDPQSAAGAGPVNVSINFQELSQFFAENSIAVTEQDGNAQGTLESFAINTNGQIIGSFTNGLTAPLGQVALATFNNPEGLSAIGNSMYAMSSNSGLPQIGVSGVGGRGSINPGALEMSNVDLAEEFTNMIIAQRGFQANSRSITTADAILNELVNIKR